MATQPPADGEVRQLLVHSAVWPTLELWLAACGIEISCAGVITEGDLPTYVMTPASIEEPKP